ncbi:DUF3147 family protein [Sulfuricurvum sp.]|uniref:DUF3147 family protein n=1 Tax=Sulfuricurvum sp. TaxID=2025608 RepID=UPI00356A0294
MGWLIAKYLVTAGLIILISEAAKRSEKLGALITALPLVTFSVLIWMYMEKQPMDKIGNYVGYVFWYALPTMPMFLLFPMILGKIGFWPTLGVSALITIVCFGIEVMILKRYGIELL